MSLINLQRNLGNMSGVEIGLEGIDDQLTYGRIYKATGPNNPRVKIEETSKFVDNCKKLGEEYSYTPLRFRDDRAFGKVPGTAQGGGYFLTVHTWEDEDPQRFINCFQYAIGTFGSKLEELCEKDMKEIQRSVSQSIDHFITNKYFTNVVSPEDGDLAIYNTNMENTHAGIYRKAEPNWNSPPGGVVESKWGWKFSHHVFQHDVFWVPLCYGNSVRFFRIKYES